MSSDARDAAVDPVDRGAEGTPDDIIDLTTDQGEPVLVGGERIARVVPTESFPVDRISDPLYQAFVATGLNRPR